MQTTVILTKILEIHQTQPLIKQELFPIEVYDKGIIHIVNGIRNPIGVLLTEKNVYINGLVITMFSVSYHRGKIL